MRMTLILKVTQASGPRNDWDEVAEALEPEIPTEVWLDDTAYTVEVVECKPVKR
jgi:hypothetical protein